MPHSPGICALELGEVARRERRLLEAEKHFTDAVDAFRQHGSVHEFAHALTRRAQIKRDLKRPADAALDQRSALAILRSLNNKQEIPHTLRHLADILQEMEKYEEAEPLYREVIALYEAAPETPPLDVANALRSVALQAEYLGDLHKAQRLWRDVRDRYAALDALFLEMTGNPENPGVAESDQRLVALAARIAEANTKSN